MKNEMLVDGVEVHTGPFLIVKERDDNCYSRIKV